LRQGAYDEALRVFAEALALNPRSGEARIGTGAALARKGEMEKAEQVLREALKSPDPVRAHYELGLIHERRGEFGPAVAEFKEGIRKSQQGRR
jgi:tetratricopeptide (TPR) repeat protein